MTRRDLNLEVVRLEAELAGIGETAKALAAEVLGLRARLDLLLDRARPIPSADPGEGPVGVAIHLENREFAFARGASE